MIGWLEAHMLPCAFKVLFGIDCPGCGFQRSVIALLRGNITESLRLYPATIPLLITCIFLLLKIKYRFDENNRVKKSLFILVCAVVMMSYCYKMFRLYVNYKPSA